MNSDFGEYQLLRLLGEGGMAQVWAARRRSTHGPRRCAIKIIKPDHANTPKSREMFARECRLALALSGHDNVVSVLDMGEYRGRPYLVMELIDGVTLAQLSREVEGPWKVAEAVEVVCGILRALSHVHALEVEGEPQAIVHRDVTPHNVMVSARGEVKLVDFGIAQRADADPRFDQALGKLSYVPREQVEGDPDQRSDLYAVGAVLFELLDGRRFRWHCADEDALFQEIYRDRVPSLRRKDVPAPVRAVLRGLLAPNREQRIATAAEALGRLEAWRAQGSTIPAVRALYGRVIRPRAAMRSAESSKADVPRPRQAWDELGDAEHSSPPPAANDSGRRRAPTVPQVAAESSDEQPGASASSEAGVVQHRRRSRTVSVPAQAADGPAPREVTGEESGAVASVPPVIHRSQRGQTPADQPIELMERFVTRRHPSALPQQDVPVARRAAEIAVTQPQPSRRAPWAEGTEPIERRLVRPEPGAPVKRRRPVSTGGGSMKGDEHTGSVAPRQRQSASMHHAAGTGVVAGEIVNEERPVEVFAAGGWRRGMR